MYKKGWLFENDGVQLHVGHLPGRKRPCVYMIDGSVLSVLAFCKDDESAQKLSDLHTKLAVGWTKEHLYSTEQEISRETD